MQQKINEIKKFLKSKGFKEKSIKSYCFVINKISNILGKEFTEQQVEDLFTKLNLKPRTYNQYRTIINFYTKKCLGYELKFTKAKVDKDLPMLVTKEEFNKVLSTIPNKKHKLAFCLMYGSGLRVEGTSILKKEHFYFDNYVIKFKGKGGKDRQTIIHPKIINHLKKFVNSLKGNNHYIFQTYRGHISERSFQERLKKAIKDSKIAKYFTCHDLRHSFSINFLEKTRDIETLRKLLGHSSLRTTQTYLQCLQTDLKKVALSLI
jgi:site-specific recombinase XerD